MTEQEIFEKLKTIFPLEGKYDDLTNQIIITPLFKYMKGKEGKEGIYDIVAFNRPERVTKKKIPGLGMLIG